MQEKQEKLERYKVFFRDAHVNADEMNAQSISTYQSSWCESI